MQKNTFLLKNGVFCFLTYPPNIEFQILYFQIIVYKKLAIPLLELYKTQSTEVVLVKVGLRRIMEEKMLLKVHA